MDNMKPLRHACIATVAAFTNAGRISVYTGKVLKFRPEHVSFRRDFAQITSFAAIASHRPVRLAVFARTSQDVGKGHESRASQRFTIHVDNMKCGACVSRIENAIKLTAASCLCSVAVLLPSQAVIIELSNPNILRSIIAKLESIGYPARVLERDISTLRKSQNLLTKRHAILLPVAMLALLPLSLFHCFLPQSLHLVSSGVIPIVCIALVLFLARGIFIDGFSSLAHLRPNMNSLIALSSTSSLGIALVGLSTGLFSVRFIETVLLLVVVLLGRKLEDTLRKEASRDIQKVLNFMREKSTRITGDTANEIECLVQDIQEGDVLKVRPGEQFPVDGVVIRPRSLQSMHEAPVAIVDKSSITGESLPVRIPLGGELKAGCLNVGQVVFLKATTTGLKSSQAILQASVARALAAKKSQMQSVADKVAAVFSWAVIAIAVVAGIVWSVFPALKVIAAEHLGVLAPFRIASSVLACACPCAMALSVPLAMASATFAAARRGIVFRDASSIEAASAVKGISFDKTGTLTTGRQTVLNSTVYEPYSSRISSVDLLKIAAKLERWSAAHPVANAVLRYAHIEKKFSVTEEMPNLRNPVCVLGCGVKATLDSSEFGGGSNDTIMCGSLQWLESELAGWSSSHEDDTALKIARHDYNEAQQNGQTITFLYSKDLKNILGSILTADELRSDAVSAIRSLRNTFGIKKFAVLSGDGQSSAKYAARAAGISDLDGNLVLGNLSARNKRQIVRKLQVDGRSTETWAVPLMHVGDGINDTPAFAEAFFSVALRDVGMEPKGAECNADAVITAGGLMSLCDVVAISRMATRTAVSSLMLSALYNLVAIPLSAGVFLQRGVWFPPHWAALLMSSSSCLVLLNSLALNLRLKGSGPVRNPE